jgi:hypothetical protein
VAVSVPRKAMLTTLAAASAFQDADTVGATVALMQEVHGTRAQFVYWYTLLLLITVLTNRLRAWEDLDAVWADEGDWPCDGERSKHRGDSLC